MEIAQRMSSRKTRFRQGQREGDNAEAYVLARLGKLRGDRHLPNPRRSAISRQKNEEGNGTGPLEMRARGHAGDDVIQARH